MSDELRAMTCTLKEAKASRRWLYVCGMMPWNWFNNDIWTAYVIWDRQIKYEEKWRASNGQQ